MTACAVPNCFARHLHTGVCEGNGCPGCRPREAETGCLCPHHFARLNGAVVDVPGLIAHLRDIGRPNAGRQAGGDGRGHGDPADRTVLPGPWLDADEIGGTLASWALLVIEERPRTVGPRSGVLAWSPGGVRSEGGETWAVEAHPRGTDDPDALVRWLLPLLPWVADQEWVAEMLREMEAMIGTAKARWPMGERGRHVQGLPCPRCEHLTLWYEPPTTARPMMQVQCLEPECGRTFGEDEWERMRGLVRLAGGA